MNLIISIFLNLDNQLLDNSFTVIFNDHLTVNIIIGNRNFNFEMILIPMLIVCCMSIS